MEALERSLRAMRLSATPHPQTARACGKGLFKGTRRPPVGACVVQRTHGHACRSPRYRRERLDPPRRSQVSAWSGPSVSAPGPGRRWRTQPARQFRARRAPLVPALWHRNPWNGSENGSGPPATRPRILCTERQRLGRPRGGQTIHSPTHLYAEHRRTCWAAQSRRHWQRVPASAPLPGTRAGDTADSPLLSAGGDWRHAAEDVLGSSGP